MKRSEGKPKKMCFQKILPSKGSLWTWMHQKAIFDQAQVPTAPLCLYRIIAKLGIDHQSTQVYQKEAKTEGHPPTWNLQISQ